MHTCDECGQACYCDMDDIPMPVDLEECDHECQEFDDDTDCTDAPAGRGAEP